MRAALALLLAPAVARADAIAHVGADTGGAIAGASLAVRTGPLELAARIDVAFERDRDADRVELATSYRSLFAGIRAEHAHAFAIAGVRLGDRSRALVLGAVARVAGDAMFVQHAGFAPGWFARGELRHSRLVFGGELGASGLATRDSDGALRGDTRGLLTLGLEVWR